MQHSTRTQTVSDRPFDVARQEAFATRFLDRLSGAGTLLMTSVGHRTGLFDAMSTAGWVTSDELARRAGLAERYVREWLGAMLAGDVVDHDPATRRYRLPAEHAALLTRAAAPNNMAVTSQWVAVLGAVEDRIVDCFVRGGGLAYADYDRFHEVMAEESGQTVVAALDAHILPLDPWIVPALERGVRVLDVGTGSGRALLHLAKRFPKSSFLGIDLCDEAVQAARRAASEARVPNLAYEVADIARGAPGRFDLVVAFDAIHDQARPDKALAAIAAALVPDGVFLMQEIRSETAHEANRGNPIAAFVYTISCMHCMSVSLGQGGAGLGAAWGRQKCEEYLRGAGFTRIRRHELPHDPMNDFWIVRR
jgi:SAM-dependent methyltransferase